MKVLLFGATGSAGGSVLKACLGALNVQEVRSITRRPLAMTHPKLRSVVHHDFMDYSAVMPMFDDIDACFFCLGVSATQVREEAAYRRITHDYALAAATALRQRSPAAAFHFISGLGTKENGHAMWARVKAETERDLMRDVDAVCWRPGFIDGEVSTTGAWYHGVLRPVFKLLKPLKSLYVRGEDLGHAMLQATVEGIRRRVIENREIRDITDRWHT